MDDAARARLLEWDSVLSDVSYYEILGVDARAGESEIRQAFHRFAQSFHPDQHLDADPATLGALRRVFQCGAEAYRVLAHGELRIRYDMALQKGALRIDTSVLPPPPAIEENPRPLDELARSAGAKLCARKADSLLAQGDLRAAKTELVKALEYDGNANSALSERLDALEVALYAMGEV